MNNNRAAERFENYMRANIFNACASVVAAVAIAAMLTPYAVLTVAGIEEVTGIDVASNQTLGGVGLFAIHTALWAMCAYGALSMGADYFRSRSKFIKR